MDQDRLLFATQSALRLRRSSSIAGLPSRQVRRCDSPRLEFRYKIVARGAESARTGKVNRNNCGRLVRTWTNKRRGCVEPEVGRKVFRIQPKPLREWPTIIGNPHFPTRNW